MAEIFQFHLLKLPRAKCKIARVNLIPERLSYLCDAKRHFLARNLKNAFELNKYCLCGLGAKISNR